MVKENILIVMEVTTLETGSREKCKVKDSFMIIKEIYNTKGNGKMTITKAGEKYSTFLDNGPNMKVNLLLAENKVSDNYIFEMVTNIRDSFETTTLGVKEECSNKTGK
jgi:hypothetical protein